MTVMLDKFFGVPQSVVRDGRWAKLTPSEQSFYVILLHESERYSTREIQRCDAQIRELSGVSSRALCNARKKLAELGLVAYRKQRGNLYIYDLCNPETGRPWPGSPKERVLYQKKGQCEPTAGSVASPIIPPGPRTQAFPVQGIAGIFEKD